MSVNNYLYKYADGTTGNSPWKQDGSGNYMLNPSGGFLEEGSFLGRSMPDGSVNQSPVGNVSANGMVSLYDGYEAPASTYYGDQQSAWGTPNPNSAAQRPPDGYGYGAPTAPGGSTGPGGAGGAAGAGGAVFGPGGTPGQAQGGTPAGQAGAMSGQNPYLQQMGDALTKTLTNNWQRNVQPQIASSAMATGGYGGSRQGVIEANSANDLNQGIGSALAGLYGNGYNTSLQYDLGVKNNQLGFGNLGLGYANLDRSINNDNNSWQLQGANFGLGVYDKLQQGNQTGIQSGTNIQNTPMNNWSQFGNQANSFGQGYGTTTGNPNQQGSPLMGALGGAQLGNQVGNWWNSSNASSSPGTAWYSGNQGMAD